METVPPRRTCGTMEVHYRLLETYPEYRQNISGIERFAARHALLGGTRRTETIRIPTVVHVVYNTDAQNIADSQVTSQIEALNRDYQAKNDQTSVPAPFSGVIGNPQVQFFLPATDPNGAATNGITRTKTTTTSFPQDDSVKSAASGGADPWPSDKYLNLWVCPLGGGLLGYAQFPGGPPATDGVVLLHAAVGTNGTATAPYADGRSAVHEVGHWLNLIHIWGDTTDCSGSDYVDDTPTQQNPNYGTPTFPHISCNNGPNGDMFMNYMDYVDDDAMVMFSQGQIVRMNATIDGPRSSVWQ